LPLRRAADVHRVLIGFIVGLLAGAAITAVLASRYLEFRDMTKRSSVELPLTTILDNITADVERGNPGLAATKTILLAEHWRAYVAGGLPPEAFMATILAEPPATPIRPKTDSGETR
jgi:hypothetical protein